MDSEALNFLENCTQIDYTCRTIVDNEIVTDECAFTSEVIIRNMKIGGVGDALLFAVSINALNAYVKQSFENKKKLGYSFKRSVEVLLRYIIDNPSEMIKAELQKDRDMSLCVLEIGGLQFSFHSVTVTDKNRVLLAKDLAHPELQWDGIRKQKCAVTLMGFAMGNTYGRSNKMLDGTDFETGLKTLLDDYHNGTKSLEDSKRTYYGKGKSVSSKSIMKEDKEYPLRNRNVAVLYEGDAGSFIEYLKNRKLFTYVKKVYEDGFGTKLDPETVYQWKYAFETFISVVSSGGISEDAAIRLAYYRITSQYFPVLSVASENENGQRRVMLIQMLSWDRMKVLDNDLVEYNEPESKCVERCQHPSSVMRMIASIYETFGKVHNIDIKSCTFFYDAGLSPDTDIISHADPKMLEESPVFYASEGEKLYEYISEICNGTNGKEVFKTVAESQINVCRSGKEEVTLEHQYIASVILGDVVSDKKHLYIIDERKAEGNRSFVDYLVNNVQKKDQVTVSIYDGIIPDSVEDLTTSKSILLCDFDALDEAEAEAYADLKEDARQAGMNVYDFDISTSIGFADLGAGINWLVTTLDIGNAKCFKYIPGTYEIAFVETEADFSEETGIANVIIPESFVYDKNESIIVASEDEKTDLYKKLLKGTRGVNLLCKNPALKEYLTDSLNERQEKFDRRFEMEGTSFTVDEIMQFTIKNLRKTTAYSRYERKVVKAIGKSAWNKLSEESQKWVVSSLMEYEENRDTHPLMDYSGVVLMVSKAFEVELAQRISIQYFEYIKSRYGDSFMDYLPEDLINERNGVRKPGNPNITTLGSIPFIMGRKADGSIYDQREYEQFLEFAKAGLFNDAENAESEVMKLCDIIYYVRVNFRNTSAHKKAIDLLVAMDCIEYCITEKRNLGVVMDIFRK